MNDFNFFSEYQRKKGIDINVRSPYFIGALIIFICLIVSLGLFLRNMMLENDIRSMTAQVDGIKASSDFALANELQNSMDAMGQYDASADIALKSFQAGDILNSQLINGLFKGIPSNVKVTSLSLDSGNFTMSCTLPNRKAAAELLMGLKGTGLLQDVQLGSVSSDQDGAGSVTTLNGVLKAGEPE